MSFYKNFTENLQSDRYGNVNQIQLSPPTGGKTNDYLRLEIKQFNV